jgi:lysophospholipase L1-like esterase
VRLFGWTADNAAGVTYETLGINGAQATVVLSWAEDLLAQHLARRDPALIVVAYGTNEAISPRWDPAAYAVAFRQVIERLRSAAPSASILVVGPPDCLFGKRTRHASSAHLSEVIAIQRTAAREGHCAYWNWRARMGGPGSVRKWVQAGLSQPDYVHMRTAGYRLTGKLLFEELMFHYERFRAPKENDQ